MVLKVMKYVTSTFAVLSLNWDLEIYQRKLQFSLNVPEMLLLAQTINKNKDCPKA